MVSHHPSDGSVAAQLEKGRDLRKHCQKPRKRLRGELFETNLKIAFDTLKDFHTRQHQEDVRALSPLMCPPRLLYSQMSLHRENKICTRV